MTTALPIHEPQHARPPSLLTFLRWVIACLDAILGATGGRHEAAARPAFGADDTYATDLHTWNEVAIEGWDRAMLVPTEPFNVPADIAGGA